MAAATAATYARRKLVANLKKYYDKWLLLVDGTENQNSFGFNFSLYCFKFQMRFKSE